MFVFLLAKLIEFDHKYVIMHASRPIVMLDEL